MFMNKIIVTGGLGFIGTNLINKLVKDKNNIILNIDKITYCSNLSTNINYNKSKNYFFKSIDLSANSNLLNKVILDYTQPEIHAIGFILPNASSSASLSTFAISVDEVERQTGIDFFPALPDDQETKLEKEVCQTCWHWQASNSKSGSSSSPKSGTSVQCSGITKAGDRCRRMTLSENGKCYQHGGN